MPHLACLVAGINSGVYIIENASLARYEMTPETIRYSKWMRLQGIFIGLVIAAAIIAFIWISSGLIPLLSLPFPIVLLGVGVGLFFLLIGIAFLAGLIVLVVHAINYFFFRLEFLETSFRIYSFSWSGKKVTEDPYSDIVHVSRGQWRGTMELELTGKRSIKLTPFLYEGKGEKLFVELNRLLPAEKLEPDLKKSVSAYTTYDKILIPIAFGILAGILIINAQSTGMAFLRSNTTWAFAIPRSFEFSYKAVSVEEDGTVWFAATSLFKKNAQIGRLQGGSTQTWDVPLSAFVDGDDAYDIIGVGGTADGNPAWITDDYFVTWTGSEWVRTPLEMEILNYLGYSTAGHAIQYLSAKEGDYQFWSCGLTERACQSLAIPDALREPGHFPVLYRGTASGPAIAVGTSKGPVSFFRYQAGAWSEIAQPLPIPEGSLLAFTIAGDGTLWVTRNLSSKPLNGGYTKGPLAFGSWIPAEGGWRWTTDVAFAKSFEMDPENMEVDPQGRIWLAGHYRTDKVTIGETAAAYTIQGEKAEEIVRYTDDNSDFQMGISDCPMVQGPDGRLWSCDMELVSLDAGAVTLPDPLAEPLVERSGNPYRALGLGIVCVLELAYFAIFGILYLQRKKMRGSG
jgi:hypothetical protein